MEKLRIFVDFALSQEAFQLLKDGTASHELVLPKRLASSVLTRAEPDDAINTADVAFGQPEPDLATTAPGLRWVHISTSGITRYDTPEFRRAMTHRNIPVTNSAAAYSEACAAHTLSFMLAQARRLPASLRMRPANGTPEWLDLRSQYGTLTGETALIVGYGAIGRRLAELLTPFKMKISAYRRRARGDENVPVVEHNDLHNVLGNSQHVINILPDSKETRGFFGAAQFARMKPGAVFYNIGRGTTVDQEALARALQSAKLAAAWLDVTDPEPLPEHHPLRMAPNCFITPHVAGGHNGEGCSIVRHFLANLERFTGGRPLLDRVI